VIGEAVILLGCVLTLLAGIGVLRFRDVFERMHALTKASSAGLILVLVGAALLLPSINDVTTLALAAFLQVLTLPVAANLIASATYRAKNVALRIDTVDELRDDEARSRVSGDRSSEPPARGGGPLPRP
jgi:multicomponent Na+:H+ antiporter subunit G